MTTYIIRRLITAIPTLIAISMVIFSILALAPGDPLSDLALNPSVPPEVRQRIRKNLGLEDPIPVQYTKWVKSTVSGDLYSYRTRGPVSDLIKQRLPTTLYISGSAFLLSLLIAIPIGVLSAVKQYSIFDNVATTLAFIGFSLPTFCTGLFFILIFTIKLGWLPSIYHSTLQEQGFAAVRERIRESIMPIMVLALFQAATFMRFVRASMLESIHQDYVRTARSKGLTERSVIGRHALRNALIPVVTIVALALPGVITGAVITEQIFKVPGMGQLLISSINNNDTPVVMTITFMFSVLVVIFNLIADVVYGVVDPRIKYS